MSVTLELQYGDWVLSPDGTFSLVTGNQKCAQDVMEGLKNNYDIENPSWFNGSELFLLDRNPVLFIRRGVGPELLIHNMVEESIRRLMDLQEADAFIDESEAIDEIRKLKVVKIGNSSYAFFLNLIVKTDQPINAVFRINVVPTPPEGWASDLNQVNVFDPNVQKTFL